MADRITPYILQNYIPVPETGCWIWLGAWNSRRYGRIASGGRNPRIASRLFYEHFVGPIPTGHFVCHKCDTPPCVNPDHLFVGTPKENAADMAAKGRHAPVRGTSNPNTRLTEADVLEIREWRESHRKTAKKFGISSGQVSNIRGRLYWTHLP